MNEIEYDWIQISELMMGILQRLLVAIGENWEDCPAEVQTEYDNLRTFLDEHREE